VHNAPGTFASPVDGDVIEGPAVLEEFSSTVPLHPGFRAEVDRFGNLVIRRNS